MTTPSLAHMSSAVRHALAARGPLVALESTILAHGLPWPDNLAIGRALEDEVRAHGATPATIAVLDGAVHIGLEADQLERVAREGAGFAKAGAADLAVATVRGTSAATTVSATAVLAARAGISVFATGGIGGVHRGDSGDVSSDLTTLARERIAVVSAGAKAILDLPRTVEMLETLGVLMLGYGTQEFPAFYTRTTGIALEHRVDSAHDAAQILAAHWGLGRGGVLIANPCPVEAALEPAFIEGAIADALGDAQAQHIVGKPLTPFLLAHLARATQGRSVATNRALALNNARVGAQVAVALAALVD
jgi:pseudouridine-5'-phosphate glycosidase